MNIGIGKIEDVLGNVTVTHTDGTTETLQTGDTVFQGDVIVSNEDSSIGVILEDGTTFSMGEEASIVLDEMVYDPVTEQGSIAMSVTEGLFVFISGSIAKSDPDAMTLNTPVATIGIRGTQVGVDVNADGETQIVLMEESDGFVGEIVVTNDTGVVVMNQASLFTTITNTTGPSAPVELTTEQILNIFSDVLPHLPITSTNAANRYQEAIQVMFDDLAMNEGEDDILDKNDMDDLAQFEAAKEVSAEEIANTVTAAGGDDVAEEEEFIHVADGNNTPINTINPLSTENIPDTIIDGASDAPIPEEHETKVVDDPVAEEPVVNDPVKDDPVDEPPVDEPAPVEPTIISKSTTSRIDTTVTVADPVTETSFVDTSTTENDLDNNKEIVTTTRTFTDTSNIGTTTITTTTPITTTTYSDGTTTVVEGDTSVTTDVTADVTTTNRNEVTTEINDPVIVETSEVVTNISATTPVTETVFNDVESREIDLPSNEEIVTVTRTYTDTTEINTTTTTTTTPITTITYSDGTVEVERGDVNIADNTITNTEVSTRETVSINTEQPDIVTTYNVNIDTVVGDEHLLTSADVVTVSKNNDLDNNREEIDTTTTTTNNYETTSTLTTTTTPVHTITYSNGTVEVEYGTDSITTDTSSEIRVEVLTDTVSTYEQPQVTVSEIITTETAVGDELLVNSNNTVEENHTNDLENNREQIDLTTTTNNTYETDTTVTTTTTPITTITYSDGTVEVERGEATTSNAVTTATREEVLTDTVTTYEIPQLVETEEVTTETVVENEVLTNTSDNVETTVTIDLDNNREQVDTTTTTTNIYSTDTTITTTTTPITTITYSDGTIEVKRGVSSSIDDISTTSREEVLTDTVVSYEQPQITTENVVTTDTVVGEPVVETSNEIVTTDVENENGTITTQTVNISTETTTVDTTISTITTPVTTITYSDGTVETENGEATVISDTTSDVSTNTSNEVMFDNTTPLTEDDSFANDIDGDGNIDVDTITFTAEDILSNDTDLDGDTLSIVSISEPEMGALVNNFDGSWSYTPDEGIEGTEELTYVITDGNATSTGSIDIDITIEADNGNSGHGNNWDGQDDDNPGHGHGGANDGKDGEDEDEGAKGNTDDDTPGSNQNHKDHHDDGGKDKGGKGKDSDHDDDDGGMPSYNEDDDTDGLGGLLGEDPELNLPGDDSGKGHGGKDGKGGKGGKGDDDASEIFGNGDHDSYDNDSGDGYESSASSSDCIIDAEHV